MTNSKKYTPMCIQSEYRERVTDLKKFEIKFEKLKRIFFCDFYTPGIHEEVHEVNHTSVLDALVPQKIQRNYKK